MNIALSTIIIFLVFLPGLIFRRFYYTEEFSKEYFKQTPFEAFVSCFVPSLLMHILWYFISLWSGYPVSVEEIGKLLMSEDYPEDAFVNIGTFMVPIIVYQLTINFFAILSGYFLKKLIRYLRWDRKYRLFRFQNKWHYLFSGEFFDFPRAAFDLTNDTVESIELIYADVMVESKDGTIIYDGILVDYELSKNHGLEYLVLKEAQRQFLTKSGSSGIFNNDYDNPGHIVLIPYEQILNFNLSYYRILDMGGDNYSLHLVS